MNGQTKTDENKTNCPSSAQKKKMGSRASASHWKSKLEMTKSSSEAVNPHYSIRVAYKGRRVRFPLETPNKDTAAGKAAKIYRHLVDHGWDKTLVEFKPGAVAPVTERGTVGALIRCVESFSTVADQTLATYVKAFRSIVAEIEDIDRGKTRRDLVDAVPLANITPTAVMHWKKDYMEQHPVKGVKTTVNSRIKNAKALFSKKLMPYLKKEVDLPTPLPFDDVLLETAESTQYKSKIDTPVLMGEAREELGGTEEHKVFLLALVFGLRASEIDHLLWDKFDFKAGKLSIENTEHHTLKNRASEAKMDLSPNLVKHFKELKKKATGLFVVESDGKVNASGYRCLKEFNVLSEWLRSKGVTARKKIHELRKECGSVIATESGIYAASRYLRHANIGITAATYADNKEAIIPSISEFI